MKINQVLRGGGVALLFWLVPLILEAQSMKGIKPMVNNQPKVIIDYGDEIDMNLRVPFRGDIHQASAGKLTSSNAAVFEVTYIDFTTEQQDAFQFAVDIWSTLLQSDVPIHLTAKMSPLGEGILGQTTVPARYANFDNAQKVNTYYVVTMAEKIAGHDLNDPGDPDITMEFSNNFPWYYGLDGSTPSNKFDFVSVILHEIGHGLGFSDGTVENNGTGYYTVYGAPMIYDRHIETLDEKNIVDTFDTGTTELGDALTSGGLFFRSFSFPLTDERPVLFAPIVWDPGSSIAHLDEETYNNTPDALMTPRFGFGESIHDPGLVLEMFEDMGWVSMEIKHQKILDTEDSLTDHTLTVIAKGDSAVLADGVNLHYTYANFSNEVVANMSPTGNPDEYSAIIPATGAEQVVSYYVNVDAIGGRSFTSPGEAPSYFWQFVMAKDTIAPVIEHEPLSIVFLHDAVVPLEATVTDNIGVGDVTLTYKVNNGAETSVVVPLINSSSDGIYEGHYSLNWDIGALGVVQGDTVKYKLSVQDVAANPNIGILPQSDFINIDIEEINPAAYLYQNDFNQTTHDFVGAGFSIKPETGFDSDAIQSNHPYRTVDGVGPADSLILYYMLKTPIILSSKDASLNFDEVVLVEPGTTGTNFGDDQFWDYVIVEGSNNLGVNWKPLADGYDSREQQIWEDKWNSDTDANNNNNSLALGDKSLFFNKEIDMTANGNFNAGDTILIRFKMYVDQLTAGWGWAVDNLKVQIDEKPPVITQITPDYLLVGDTSITLKAKVEDNVEVDSVIYEFNYNNQPQLFSLPGSAGLYSVGLTFPAITATDVLKYRIIAVDKAPTPNTTILPDVGFFEIPVAVLGETKTMYSNDFNTASDDFIGTHFSINTADKFNDPAILSPNPYPDAPFDVGEISYLLKYPIKLNQSSAWVQYDEQVLTEPGVDKVAFDVSNDGGTTWTPAFDPYDASVEQFWSNVFSNKDKEGNSTGVAEPSMIKTRLFNILDNPDINGGDEVLVRFRISMDDSVHGWGWIIDNLEIQSPTTGIEDQLAGEISVYPNPTNSGLVKLTGKVPGDRIVISVTDLLGKQLIVKNLILKNNQVHTTLDLSTLQRGIYLISGQTNNKSLSTRVVVE